MAGENNSPLFPEDITRAAQDPEAATQDIADLLQAMRSGPVSEQVLIDQMAANQRLVRRLGFGILTRLSEMGVKDAETLTDELAHIDSEEEPILSDMSAVASRYDEDRVKAVSPQERQDLQRLSRLSHAVSALATTQALVAIEGNETDHARFLIGYSEQSVDEAAPLMAESDYNALDLILSELQPTSGQ